ncbi:MAG: hypothetical protein IJV27_12995 [Prevotella sp.]|nr:hypothetical protein [Prevotella sp.]
MGSHVPPCRQAALWLLCNRLYAGNLHDPRLPSNGENLLATVSRHGQTRHLGRRRPLRSHPNRLQCHASAAETRLNCDDCGRQYGYVGRHYTACRHQWRRLVQPVSDEENADRRHNSERHRLLDGRQCTLFSA